MRVLQGVVKRPEIRFRIQGNGLLGRPLRSRRKKGSAKSGLQVRRNHVEVGDPRQMTNIVDAYLAAGVLQRVGEAAGSILIERVDQLKARPVIYLAEAGANDSFVALSKQFSSQITGWAQGIRNGDAGRKVVLAQTVEAWTVIRRAAGNEGDRGLGGEAESLLHIRDVDIELLAQAERGGYLQAIRFVRGWKQRPAHTVGEGEIGLHAPGVLAIELIPVQCVMTLHRRALGQKIPGAIVIVLAHEVGHDAEQPDHRTVVTGLEGEVDFWEPMQTWVHGAGTVGDAGWRHPAGSPQCEIVGVQITHPRIAGHADVAANLQTVSSLGPGKIVGEIVNRKLKILAIGDALIETDEGIPGLIGVAQDSVACPRESVMKAVDGAGTDHVGVADGEPLAVVINHGFRRCAWEEGFAQVVPVLKVPAEEQSVLAGGVEVIVEACHDGVVRGTDGRAEAVARVIQAIAHGEIIGYEVAEVLIEVRLHDGTRPDAIRIHVRDVLRAESPESRRYRVGIHAVVARDVSSGAGRGIERAVRFQRALVAKDAIAHGLGRDRAYGAVFFALPCTFVVREEEQPVFLNRAPERDTENIAVELQRLVGLVIEQFRGLHQIIIGAGEAVPQIFVSRSVEAIGAAFRDQRNLCPGALPLISAIVCGGNTKLLN